MKLNSIWEEHGKFFDLNQQQTFYNKANDGSNFLHTAMITFQHVKQQTIIK